MRGYLVLALSLCALTATAAPLTRSEHAIIMTLADILGVPRSVADRLQIEESGDPRTGAWGDSEAQGPVGSDGARCLGLYQINPRWMADLVGRYYPHPASYFDAFNPIDSTVVALGYLSALHKRFGTWERALWFYNCGRVTDVSASTREYARRIVEWNKED